MPGSSETGPKGLPGQLRSTISRRVAIADEPGDLRAVLALWPVGGLERNTLRATEASAGAEATEEGVFVLQLRPHRVGGCWHAEEGREHNVSGRAFYVRIGRQRKEYRIACNAQIAI